MEYVDMKIQWWASDPYINARDLHKWLDHILVEAYSFSYVDALREVDDLFEKLGAQLGYTGGCNILEDK